MFTMFTFFDTFTGLTAVSALLSQLVALFTGQHADERLQTLVIGLLLFLLGLLLLHLLIHVTRG